MKLLILATLVLGFVGRIASQDAAEPCDETQCIAPNCRCSSTDTPGGLDPSEIPHFVVLSFDDGVTISNHPFYEALSERKNPNGCGIGMTFFVSHENTDYTLVNDLYRKGHEIAVHSVTHKADVENYWRKLTKEQWKAEIDDQRKMLAKYGKIGEGDIKGFRAPFLEVGGDEMYEALSELDFEYDCSWASLQYTPWFVQPDQSIKGALWPYTLDYLSVQDKTVGTPPTKSIPGLWVSPMTDLQDNRDVECSMLDACQGSGDELETISAAVFNLLKRNFRSHFDKRTPFGVYTHHSWFYYDDIVGEPIRKNGFSTFLDYLESFNYVYVVSVQQLIEWMKNPVSVADLPSHPAFKCAASQPIDMCPEANHATCSYGPPLPINQTEIRMTICDGPCPNAYPWIGNTDGV